MAAQVFHTSFDGKQWRIAAIHGFAPHRWAWLVNINMPTEQVRLSLNAPEFDHMPSLRTPGRRPS